VKIVFFGTSHFSSEILAFLQTLPHEIVAIVTKVDKPQGRDLRCQPCPVKQQALAICPHIPLLQPEKASTDTFCEELKAFDADLFLVVAYGEILRNNILSLPSLACINIHTSLLPKYRGAAPIQRCLMQGEPISGVTFMEMALKMDAGDILLQETVAIPTDMDCAALEHALLQASLKRLPEFLEHFEFYYQGKKSQKEEAVTFAPKILSEDCLLHFSGNAELLHNQIRALSPNPGAYTILNLGTQSKRLKILKSRICTHQHTRSALGLWVQNSSLYITTSQGSLEVLEVQLEGKKAMKVKEFLAGMSKYFSLS
jgi:methionyl-tRNA formyltransferase